MKLVCMFFLFAIGLPVSAIVKKAEVQQPRWMLSSFIEMAAKDPERLLRMGERLLAEDRMRMTSVEAGRAFEWQHRLAMVTALSELFSPDLKGKGVSLVQRERARKILALALAKDPSLLVRDGTVESVRRILRMQSGERSFWIKPLERAFLDRKNAPRGEGYFIRETILVTMREANVPLSKSVRDAAIRDKSPSVRDLAKHRPVKLFDDLPPRAR